MATKLVTTALLTSSKWKLFWVKIIGEQRERDKGRRSKTKAKVSGWGPYKRIRRCGMAGRRESQPASRQIQTKKGSENERMGLWGDGTVDQGPISQSLP